jgi:hypothetical protein
MTEITISRLKKLFSAVQTAHPSLQAYLIIDSSRLDEEQCHQLSEINEVNLWHEDIRAETDKVVLHLLQVSAHTENIDWILALPSEAVFIFFSPYKKEAIQQYYSAFTHINLEESEGKSCKAIFGFFDPQIIANYVSTLYTEEKIQEFFAGIGVIASPIIEDSKNYYIAYRNTAGYVNAGEFALADIDKTLNLTFGGILLPESESHLIAEPERHIDHHQYKLFQDIERDKYLELVYNELDEEPYVLKANPRENTQLVHKLYNEARDIEITSEGGVYHYLLLGLYIGSELKDSKLYEGLSVPPTESGKVNIIKKLIEEIPKKQEKIDG